MEKKKIEKQVISDMQTLGTYKPEYGDIIKTYINMVYEYRHLSKLHEESGFKLEEEYTNKAGATNMRKTNILGRIEKLELSMAQYSDRLCLNPKALENIAVEKETKSKLASVLSSIE